MVNKSSNIEQTREIVLLTAEMLSDKELAGMTMHARIIVMKLTEAGYLATPEDKTRSGKAVHKK